MSVWEKQGEGFGQINGRRMEQAQTDGGTDIATGGLTDICSGETDTQQMDDGQKIDRIDRQKSRMENLSIDGQTDMRQMDG